ncbi:MAG TPA: FAD-dependent monooxygenase [Phenylobacterium sp.]|uniref:FAD-dependent monooxygenase n=1 Tax=Phenylobacterium sp. TaxID=1871053 RepID=UPI002B497A4A|nr:FAD-dependent monooxygenase [Phenylobacterium sp.]HKR90208.1 FAD-dependent monooxygenase [Phenylobacterium sp.]
MIEDTFVLIVGGGPVGLTLALDLGKRRIPAILVNEYTETARHPKCNYINTRTMEHFRRLGVADEVRNSGLASDFPRAVAYRTRFCGFELGRIPLSFLALEEWPGPEYPLNISQLVVEPILKHHAEQMPDVSVRFGWRLTSLDQADDGVEGVIENVATGERKSIRARYAVGCDGSRSVVRSVIGSGLSGEDGSAVRNFVSGTMLAYFFQSENLLASAGHAPAVMTWIINHDARGYIMSQNGRDRFVAHFQVPADVDWRTLDSSDVLNRMLGPGIDYSIISQGPWTGGLALIADQYAQGNIFLAGDAAHLFTPLGGFGLNTGVGDAINLGWKLAAVHDGWGGAGLLETYEAERRPIGERNSRIGVKCAARKDHWEIPADINEPTADAEAKRKHLGAYIEIDDREEYATIGLQLGERYASSIIRRNSLKEAAPDPWDNYIPSDAAGARAPHFSLPDGRSLYDEFGDGFCLVAFGSADCSNLEHAAAERSVPMSVVRLAARPRDYDHDLVLVRPDHHIAWSGDRLPADCFDLIDQVRGASACKRHA